MQGSPCIRIFQQNTFPSQDVNDAVKIEVCIDLMSKIKDNKRILNLRGINDMDMTLKKIWFDGRPIDWDEANDHSLH
jgi:hypothetical protein